MLSWLSFLWSTLLKIYLVYLLNLYFRWFYDRPGEMIKALRKKSISLFRFEKSVLSSNHFFHARGSHLNGSSQKFRDHIFSAPYRKQGSPITSCDREAQEAGKFHVQSGTYGLTQRYTEEPHKLCEMITWGLQYLLCGSRAGTNIEGWVTVIPTWKVLSPLVPPMWSNGNPKYWYGILSGGILTALSVGALVAVLLLCCTHRLCNSLQLISILNFAARSFCFYSDLGTTSVGSFPISHGLLTSMSALFSTVFLSFLYHVGHYIYMQPMRPTSF